MSATVTYHYFFLLKLHFDACNQFSLCVCFALRVTHSEPHTQLLHGNGSQGDNRGVENWPDLATTDLAPFEFFVSSCILFYFFRCMSCLSTRWKCYWDQENHLCLSNKDDSKHHLIEVSIYNLSSRHMPGGGHGINVLIVTHNPDVAGTTITKKKVFFNKLTPDWLGKSNHGVIHCEVIMSQLQ